MVYIKNGDYMNYLKEYYSENDFSKNWFRLNKNKILFYGKRDSLLS